MEATVAAIALAVICGGYLLEPLLRSEEALEQIRPPHDVRGRDDDAPESAESRRRGDATGDAGDHPPRRLVTDGGRRCGNCGALVDQQYRYCGHCLARVG